MDSLFHSQIQFILKLGTGIKACLFDEETKSMISSLIPLSLFNDNNFFHFDLLSNKARSKVEGMCCIIILRPESLKLLLEELVCPYFGSYIVLFTSQIDPLVLELMANADINSLVSEIHEINLDLHKQAPNLYITKSSKYKRNLEGLCSALYSLEINPEILIFNEEIEDGPNKEKGISFLGKDLRNKCLQYNFAKKGTFVLLKRNFDLITPLVQDWYYHSMINDCLELNDNLVKLNGKTYQVTDSFSIKNFFNEIATVGEEIKKLAKDVEKNKVGVSNFEDIQDLLNLKSMAEMHLCIYNSIANETDNLISLSELQSKILKSTDFKISTIFEHWPEQGKIEKNFFNDENVTEENQGFLGNDKETRYRRVVKMNTLELKLLNLLLIYFLKNDKDWIEASKQFPKYRSHLIKFYELYKPQAYPYKYSFDNEVDPKLGYIAPIKKIIKHISQNKIKENAFVTLKGKDDQRELGKSEVSPGPIVLFIEGGITLREYRETILYSRKHDIEVILISNEILNSKSLINGIL